MSVIELPSQTELKSIFNYDFETGIFTWKIRPAKRVHIGDIAGNKTKSGYINIAINSILYRAHRLAWKYYYGIDPENSIDHMNGNTFDNRIINLREATYTENTRNCRKYSNNSSGFKGVSYYKKTSRYVANASKDGINKFLGYFDTAEEASDAYISFTKLHFKEFYKEIV